MIVGFTGTQKGMTENQWRVVATLLQNLQPTECHHGDCVGADADFDALCHELGLGDRIVIHPPQDSTKRAFCYATQDKRWPPKPYLVRNHDIVNCCDVLLACPKSLKEELRSGTWATIRYANRSSKRVEIIV